MTAVQEDQGEPLDPDGDRLPAHPAPLELPEAFGTMRGVVLVPDKGLDRVMSVIEVLVQEGLELLSLGPGGGTELSALVGIYSFRATIGSHGVRTAEQARAVVAAGAAFAICSRPEPGALDVLSAGNVPFLLDALTPTEVGQAWEPRRAAAIHVQPAEVLGRRYAEVLPELVPGARLVPSVTDDDVAEAWLNGGAAAVSLSSSVLSRVFASEDFSSLRQRAGQAAAMLARHR